VRVLWLDGGVGTLSILCFRGIRIFARTKQICMGVDDERSESHHYQPCSYVLCVSKSRETFCCCDMGSDCLTMHHH
jgi:hypothetical protein